MDDSIITALIASGTAAAGVIVSKWLPTKGSTEDALIGRMDARMTKMDDRLSKLEARERVLLGYVSVLRFHIDQGKGPPAPEYPEELR